MELPELMELRTSNEAPFDHASYTVWLHNKIIENLSKDLVAIAGKEISIDAALVIKKFFNSHIIQ